MNFWTEIKKPVFSLAPMEDVTDTVFRELILRHSHPDYLQVLFTEFASTDGLCHVKGKPNVSLRFKRNQSELDLLKKMGIKLVAQIWGASPEHHYQSAKMVSEMGFDGIDINMGCPIKKIVKQGACSALIAQPELAKEIILATKEATHLPVSVKTRIGIKQKVTEEWIGHLLNCDIAALSIHGRTQAQQSEGLADWDEIGKGVSLRNSMNKPTLIFGNGDIMSYNEGIEKVNQYQLDGIMVGRGIFKNPWFFNPTDLEISIHDRLNILEENLKLFTKTWGQQKRFNTLKRFFKIYINNFEGAADLRARLMETQDPPEAYALIESFREKLLLQS